MGDQETGLDQSLICAVWRYDANSHTWSVVASASEITALQIYEDSRKAKVPGTAYLVRPLGWTPLGDVITKRLAEHAVRTLAAATSRRAAGQDELQAKRLAKEAEKSRADQQKRCKRKSAERRSPTGRNLEIIETLKDQGPLCSRDLARAMGVPVAVVAQRINQLERDRHVQGGPSRQSGTWVWSVTEAKKEAS